MTSVGDLISSLTTTAERAAAIAERLAAYRAEVHNAVRQYSTLVQGSGRPEVRAALERWRTAEAQLDSAIGRLLSGGHFVAAYVRFIGGLGGQEATVGTPSPGGTYTPPEAEDRASRLARLRRELTRQGEDVVDATRATTNSLRAPAPSSSGSTTPRKPAMTPTAQTAPTVGDIVSGLVVGGIVVAEGTARVIRALRRLKEWHVQSDR